MPKRHTLWRARNSGAGWNVPRRNEPSPDGLSYQTSAGAPPQVSNARTWPSNQVARFSAGYATTTSQVEWARRAQKSATTVSAPANPDPGLTEVDLGLGAWVMGERDRHPAQAGPTVIANPRSDGRLATGEAVSGDETLPDPPGGVALLVVDLLVGLEPGLDDRDDPSMTGAGRRRVRRYVQGTGSSRARRIVVRLLWRARASSRMLDASRRWA